MPFFLLKSLLLLKIIVRFVSCLEINAYTNIIVMFSARKYLSRFQLTSEQLSEGVKENLKAMYSLFFIQHDGFYVNYQLIIQKMRFLSKYIHGKQPIFVSFVKWLFKNRNKKIHVEKLMLNRIKI
jgi:hypothetical protein